MKQDGLELFFVSVNSSSGISMKQRYKLRSFFEKRLIVQCNDYTAHLPELDD